MMTREVIRKATMATISCGSATRKESIGGARSAKHKLAMPETTIEERKSPVRDSSTTIIK
jgi:hypothetical protein